jgi:hypothetical protein
MRRFSALACALLFCGCGAPEPETGPAVTCPGEGDYAYADQIVDAPGRVEAPSAVNRPEYAIDGEVVGDPMSGSTRVFSRGMSTEPANNYVILEWTDRVVVDAPGADIVVFENAFETDSGVFIDPAIVAVSEDGERWLEFPHDFLADDETVYSANPDDWEGFAGVTPVRWDSRDCTDPFDSAAGGDRFDLADLELGGDGVRFVRLVAAPTVENPDSGEPFPRHFISDGFDLDGVYAARTKSTR